MKLATWNINSIRARTERLHAWLEARTPDVVCLQELKCLEEQVPVDELRARGYEHIEILGQKTYNGVAILSREEPRDVVVGVPGFEHEHRRAISATIGDLRIVNLYVVNGQDVGTEKYELKLQWLAAVHAWRREEARAHPRLVVLGDFNIAPDARDVHDPDVWNDDHILTSSAEREALRRLQALGLHDAFRLHSDEAGVFSWWDYRQAAFRRNLGLRIDLTLVSEGLRPQATASGIDREPRTWERPSDHAPAWVTLAG